MLEGDEHRFLSKGIVVVCHVGAIALCICICICMCVSVCVCAEALAPEFVAVPRVAIPIPVGSVASIAEVLLMLIPGVHCSLLLFSSTFDWMHVLFRLVAPHCCHR